MRRFVRRSVRRASLRVLGRAVALALFALFAGAHVLPAVHHATVRHAVCAVHGALQHADEGEAVAVGVERAESAELAVSEEGHGDEHCSVLGALSERAAGLAGPEATRAARSSPAAPPPPDTEQAHSSLPVLAFAPKLAPPA